MTTSTTTTMNEQTPSLDFPTGSSVPFPYPTPYPQQTALMDTLLQCLRQKEELEASNEQQQDGPNTTQKASKRRQRAAVMMLESPTGTGKSLSLACSAMAWLKYCEQRDLHAPVNNTDDANTASATTDTATTTNTNEDDWWNAWVPPETTQREHDWKETQQTAQVARRELKEELELWRSKLYGDKPSEDRAKQRRENFVRSAVTTAKMAERSVGGRKRIKKTKQQLAAIKQQQQSKKHEDFCVQDYTSDPEQKEDTGMDSDSDDDATPKADSQMNAKQASQLLDGHRLDGSFRKATNVSQPSSIAQVAPGTGVRKIIYAARTHSQLSQFVGELKRTAWGGTTRVVALGSRQLLCGNAKLKKSHPTESSLTEACLDLKQGTTTTKAKTTGTAGVVESKKRTKSSSNKKGSGGCPLLESKEAVSTLGLHLLTTPSDIEDAARLGSASHTCAYYASRKALAAAEVVVLPYSMLLSKPTRQAIGLSLEGSLVLVDEAHNLPETLRQLHSSQLSLPVIQAAIQQLTRYTQTYAQRLAGRNLMYLGNLRKLLRAFAKYLKGGDGSSNNSVKNAMATDKENSSNANKAVSDAKKRTLQSTGEFLLGLKLDNINLFKLLRYLEHSRLSQKLLGFTRAKNGEDEAEQQSSETGLSKHVSAMSIVQTFLEKLNLKGEEGKIVTDWPASSTDGSGNTSRVQHPTLRYVLLHPASCFDNVLEEAHALALVGGTLAPFGHVAAELLASDNEGKQQSKDESFLQLASQADTKFQAKANSNNGSDHSMSFVSSQFAAFSCDHVVPSRNVKVKCLSFGPGNSEKFDFRHKSRMAPSLCQELGRALLDIAKVVPHGLVIFLPSYSYEAHLVSQWQKSGLWTQLNSRKKIFREPKSAQHLESTLRAYGKQAATGERQHGDKSAISSNIGGALLLAVIGGKMSEGINLANDMARGVVVVGLPYPDITDPELQEKMSTMTKHGIGGLSGQAYYQNLCMRAVNQSVGRAIRHANDYAAIFLCDYRYSTQRNIWSGLPKWVRNAAGDSPQQHAQQPYSLLARELQSFFHERASQE